MAPLSITFHRAPAQKSLISLKLDANNENIVSYPFPSIKLINPTLNLAMAHSDYYDKKYAPHKLERIFFPFSEMSIRRDTLVAGQSDFKLKLSDGPLPTHITFGLMKPDDWDGSYETSITHFKPYGLQFFDLQVRYFKIMINSTRIYVRWMPNLSQDIHWKSTVIVWLNFTTNSIKNVGFGIIKKLAAAWITTHMCLTIFS